MSTANWVRVGVAAILLTVTGLCLAPPLIDCWYLGQVTGEVWLATGFIVLVLSLYGWGLVYTIRSAFELAREIEEDQK